MRSARLDKAQAGIKIAERNINNRIYGDNATLMAGSKEELKSLLMKVKEASEKTGLNFNNLSYANDTTLMAESEEELKSFLMTVKEENEKLA